MKWTKGDRPPEDGYYIATWRCQRGDKIVSELWFSSTNGWFASRGYLAQLHGDKINKVVAWMPLPKAA